MIKRRNFGDVVQLDDEVDGPYQARIVEPVSGDGYEECWLAQDRCADPDCREWWTLEVLDNDSNPTGEHVYHISECAMSDAHQPIYNSQEIAMKNTPSTDFAQIAEKRWNATADEFNQWDALGQDERDELISAESRTYAAPSAPAGIDETSMQSSPLNSEIRDRKMQELRKFIEGMKRSRDKVSIAYNEGLLEGRLVELKDLGILSIDDVQALEAEADSVSD